METKDELQVMDHLTIPTTKAGTSFSQLLLGDDDNDNDNPLGLDVDQTFSTSLFSLHNTPKMLCFGDYQNEIHDTTNVILTPQKSIITSSDSSSASSCNHQTNTGLNSLTTTKSNSLQKKRNGSGGQELGTKAGVGGQKGPKKIKADNPTSTGHAKPKKEKLGERIAALQQLVSPFGKTDTASVLHEATGYIRFLHDQVQVLCSPYLQPSQVQFQNQPGDGDNNVNVNVNEEEEVGEEEVKNDLRSRGLCLIPVGCTLHVASSNGADFWSPASIGNNDSPSTIAKQ